MFDTAPAQRRLVVVFRSTLCAVLVFSTSASAQQELFFEETAEAFWQVPHQCESGAVVQATLLVRSTRDFNAPDRDDPDPTARVQFLAPCPNASSAGSHRLPRQSSRAQQTSRASPLREAELRETISEGHTKSPSTWRGRATDLS
jgi:hypothetical protein